MTYTGKNIGTHSTPSLTDKRDSDQEYRRYKAKKMHPQKEGRKLAEE
jgi:hypothetical protein